MEEKHQPRYYLATLRNHTIQRQVVGAKIESKQELHRLNTNKRRLRTPSLSLCGGINMLICILVAALRALCNFNTF